MTVSLGPEVRAADLEPLRLPEVVLDLTAAETLTAGALGCLIAGARRGPVRLRLVEESAVFRKLERCFTQALRRDGVDGWVIDLSGGRAPGSGSFPFLSQEAGST